RVPSSLHSSPHLRDLHSFPTRRSSDLLQVAQQAHLATHFEDANYPLLQTEAALEQYLYAHTALNTIQHEALEHPAPIAVGCSKADRKSTRLNSSHVSISYAVFCLKKKN